MVDVPRNPTVSTPPAAKARMPRTAKCHVALIDLGSGLPIDLRRLSWRLNHLQRTFRFSVDGAVSATELGAPDVEDERYDAPTLLNLMESRFGGLSADIVMGVTRAKITFRAKWDAKPDKDYFCLSDQRRNSIVSVNPRVLQHSDPDKGVIRYAVFLIMCELLINYCKTDLTHFGEEMCLFNECEDRAMLAECIAAAAICQRCETTLKLHEIDDSTVKDVRRVLSWCQRNTWRTALRYTIANPLTSLGLGIASGWLVSLFLDVKYWPIALLVALFPAAGVLLHGKLRTRKD